MAKSLNNNTCLGWLYDVLAQSISILDVTTDIIVCVAFYQKERFIFFGISLAILILALIAYDVAFMAKYSNEYHLAPQIGLFLSLLPISPFIPFIFYYVSDNDSQLASFMSNHWCFDISFYRHSTTRGASKFKQFAESKVVKHLGFIIESLVEALPQAILQMASIVIYNEANIISITSILISLLSVCSKSLVFSMGTATNMKQLFFNWLCAVTDFFGIFVVVCWVTYHPHEQHLSDAFIMIRNVWLNIQCILVFPMIAFVSVMMHIVFSSLIVYETDGTKCKKISYGIYGFFGVTLAWICGVIASTLVAMIMCWTWIAAAFLFLGIERFPQYHKLSLEFWYTLIRWINNAKQHRIGTVYKGCTSYTKQQDRMMRVASLNYCMASDKRFGGQDNALVTYLEKERRENQYMNVTMKALRMHTNAPDQAQFDRKCWRWYSYFWRSEAKRPIERQCREICVNRSCHNNWHDRHDCCLDLFFATGVGSLTFVFGPIYFVSRVVQLFYPMFIVLYLYFGYDVLIWNTTGIDMFQIVMMTIYIVLCGVLGILFYLNAKEQYLMAHLLPHAGYISYRHKSESDVENNIQKITNHYYGIIVVPIRKAMIIERFGPDLGPIIVSYLPSDDKFELAGDVVRVTTVV
eukprot:601023_1